jgi:peptidoglycan hydrolase-like protein with peptidoglycan-binding domain
MQKLQKLNKRGFSHHIVLAAFVVVFAVAGVAYLVASHAQTAQFAYHNQGCTKHTYGILRGGKKQCIQAIQYAVAAHPVDGSYGPGTANRVAAIQPRFGLGNSGKVNGATWERMICPKLRYLRENIRTSASQRYFVISGCTKSGGSVTF